MGTNKKRRESHLIAIREYFRLKKTSKKRCKDSSQQIFQVKVNKKTSSLAKTWEKKGAVKGDERKSCGHLAAQCDRMLYYDLPQEFLSL